MGKASRGSAPGSSGRSGALVGVCHKKRAFALFASKMTRFPSAKCLILPSRRPLDRLRKRQGPWDRVTWHFSCRDCNMNISEVDSSVKHSGCNSNQVQEAIRSIRQWAAFRAFKEAKAAGRETFTVEDWQRWMAVAGHSLGNPSDEEFSAKFRFTNLSRISSFFSGIAVFDLRNNKQIGINCRKCFLIRKIY